MKSWAEFAATKPEVARAGEALLYQHGVGLGLLATTRADGGPRVHPMCPLLTSEGLYAFIVPSPKREDLHRDGRYAIHSFPCPDNEDAFYITGSALAVADRALRAALAEQFVKERLQFPVAPPPADDELFEFRIDSCLLTRTTGHGDPNPVHTVWRPTSAERPSPTITQ